MKYKVLIFTIFVFLVCSCSSTKKQNNMAKSVETLGSQMAPDINNHSFLKEEDAGVSVAVKGHLVKAGDSYILKERWKSRGEVSFVLQKDDEYIFVYNLLETVIDKDVKIQGKLIKVLGNYKKVMTVEYLQAL